MKTCLDCFPCFLNQTLNVARIITDDKKIHHEIMTGVMGKLLNISFDMSPPEVSQIVYSTISEITKIKDPYFEEKKEQNRRAMELYQELKEKINKSETPLFLAARVAIAGNIIDLGINRKMGDVKTEIFSALNSPITINDFSKFEENLQQSKQILYLGDNAGEIVFDKLFIEAIKKEGNPKVIFVVRGGPIINDATLDDAKFAGMEEVAEVMDNGFNAPGTILSKTSSIISDLFAKSDMVISKGQGNYESLNEEQKNIFFFLKAKCQIVAKELGVNVGDAILKHQHQEGRSQDSI